MEAARWLWRDDRFFVAAPNHLPPPDCYCRSCLFHFISLLPLKLSPKRSADLGCVMKLLVLTLNITVSQRRTESDLLLTELTTSAIWKLFFFCLCKKCHSCVWTASGCHRVHSTQAGASVFFFCLNVIWSDCGLFLSPISPLRSHFQLAGGVVLAVGIWTLIEKSDYISLLSSKTYVASTYILVLAGAVVMVTGVLGCCATFKEHRKLLRVVSDCDTRRQDQSKQWSINQLLKKKVLTIKAINQENAF